jgi:UDP-N-acetylmuramoylalanine--D-glutamate ligase
LDSRAFSGSSKHRNTKNSIDVKEAQIAVLGAGISGTGAALLGQKKGLEVFVSDAGRIKETNRKVLENAEISFEEEGHSEDKILKASQIIKSPGIPDEAAIVQKAEKKGIPIIDELEFAGRYTTGKLIGITGTNGKTTTVGLVGEILKNAGLDVFVGGNVGMSMAKELSERDHDWWVLEVSSFQLDGLKELRFDIAAILNITPDHLERYGGSFDRYVASKFRITMNQTPEDHFVFCADDQVIQKRMSETVIQSQKHGFSWKSEQENGAWASGNKSIIINVKQQFEMNIQQLALQGRHNSGNSMAASVISSLLDIRKEVIRDSLSNFQNIEHRLEKFMSVFGVDYINDSKATNVNSTWYALESMRTPTVWIAGGVDKGNDYSKLEELVDEKVKSIIILGEDTEKIRNAFADKVEQIEVASNMREAVSLAYRMASKGDTVLLSPACASFDLFENYEERGNTFKEMVRSL